MGKSVAITDEQRRQVQVMASLGLSNEDISTVVKLNRRTMERRCEEQLVRGRASMRGKLLKIQWELAQKSAAMAIWLGKQYLGQKDQPLPPGQEGATIEYVQRIITNAPGESANAAGGSRTTATPGEVSQQPGEESGPGRGPGGGQDVGGGGQDSAASGG